MLRRMFTTILALALLATPSDAQAAKCKKLRHALVLLRDDEPGRALECLEELKNRPRIDLGNLHYLRGQAFWEQGERAKAVSAFQLAIRERERQRYKDDRITVNPSWFAILGQAHYDARALPEAVEAFGKAGRDTVLTRPDWVAMYAEALYESSNASSAWTVLQWGAERYPNHPELLRRRAWVALETGRPVQALEAATKLAEVAPDAITDEDRSVFEAAQQAAP
ncbi:MAG: tetratricopeptide repeat protein [Myxococcota bacterium]